MNVLRFLVIATLAAVALNTVASSPEADSDTAEAVSNDALDVILGASSKVGSAVAGATDTGESTSGSNSASAAAVGVFTTAMAVATAVLM